MQHTLVALVEDKPGVLNRVASLFRRRAFNIDSLTVGHTHQPGVSRMTIGVTGEGKHNINSTADRIFLRSRGRLLCCGRSLLCPRARAAVT